MSKNFFFLKKKFAKKCFFGVFFFLGGGCKNCVCFRNVKLWVYYYYFEIKNKIKNEFVTFAKSTKLEENKIKFTGSIFLCEKEKKKKKK